MTTSDADDIATILAILVILVIVGIVFMLGFFVGFKETKTQLNELANNPQLKQCLSHTGAEWRDGECIISIFK